MAHYSTRIVVPATQSSLSLWNNYNNCPYLSR